LPLLILILCTLAGWGKDINPGAGPQLLNLVSDDLAKLLKDDSGLDAFLAAHGATRIEAIKRFRNPELLPLFVRLLDSADWKVQHRALLALEYVRDPSVLDRAWALLSHPHRRLREKAAITLIKLWDGRKPPADWEGVRGREQDFHVRSCLDALALRIAGRLPVERVSEEVRDRAKNGLLFTPFVSGLDRATTPVARAGQGSAARLPPSPLWNLPLLGYGEEEVEGTSLQPFANLRNGGRTYHTGQDVGACLDGCGFYAAADGVVKLVHSGSDMGTLLVLEHLLPGRDLVCAVYMHGGDTVFVKAGETVACGQLLGTMGLSFSVENGGHFAHLHYGLYPGAFDMGHNYGYRDASKGLSDWIDPAKFLPQWIERTRPLVERLRPVARSVERIGTQVARGEYARAYEAAVRVRERAEPGSEEHVDATYLADMAGAAPRGALARATRIRDMGYPGDARDELRAQASALRGIPGADALAKALEEWERDPLFAKALKGEPAVARALRSGDRAKLDRLLSEYGDTCLGARLRP